MNLPPDVSELANELLAGLQEALGANLAGLPGISIPAGQSKEGLPIGMQILGPAFAEDTLLRAAHMFESATDWHQLRPPMVASNG